MRVTTYKIAQVSNNEFLRTIHVLAENFPFKKFTTVNLVDRVGRENYGQKFPNVPQHVITY